MLLKFANKMLDCLIFFVLDVYLTFLEHTLSVDCSVVGEDLLNAKGSVLATAHHGLLVALISYRKLDPKNINSVTLLISRSKDGDIIANLMAKRHYKVVRGSSSRGAKESLIELQGNSNHSCVAIAFDGPKGPPLKPKNGVIICGKSRERRVYLTIVEPVNPSFKNRAWFIRLKSWDRFLLPLPFAKIKVTYEMLPRSLEKTDKEWQEQTLQIVQSRSEEKFGELYINWKKK